MASAIEVEGLGKRYRLGEDFGGYLTIREAFSSWPQRHRRSDGAPEIWALRDVDLALEEGEVLGVVGRNGAGKSTLLKILARITEPTVGVARTRGRVGALLEVGTGFHPELTGRENVYLNGAILGMSKREIGRRFDQIVDFAGVEQFLDTPLKRYSTGMNLRLAFAVAAHLEPPIMVVDEVLASGDAEFQRRCLGKMSELRDSGRTVVFVSHDLGAVRDICPRVAWLDRGAIQEDGPADEVIRSYLSSALRGSNHVEFEPRGTEEVELMSASILDSRGKTLDAPRRDHPFQVRIRFRSSVHLPHLDVAIYVLNQHGVRVLDEAWSDTQMPPPDDGVGGSYEATLTIPPFLAPGEYQVGVWVGSTIGVADETFIHAEVLRIHLWPHPSDRKEWIERRRVAQPAVRWNLTRGALERQ